MIHQSPRRALIPALVLQDPIICGFMVSPAFDPNLLGQGDGSRSGTEAEVGEVEASAGERRPAKTGWLLGGQGDGQWVVKTASTLFPAGAGI